MALNPLFRREWSSAYEALQDCRPDLEKLMQLYIQQMSQAEPPVLAIDRTAWLRQRCPTLKERTYEHQPTALPLDKAFERFIVGESKGGKVGQTPI